ncbi:VC0807 family protein [Allokutzneria multivorans]|uniref:VC0807 family protein n=1 Tax=Allokutzneria multivorans TaxID=1142134 RepID=UPI0031F11A76
MPKSSKKSIVPVLLFDVGLPLGAYYGARALGFAEYHALLAATLVAGARVGYAAWRRRTFDAISMVMLLMFGVGLALSFVTGEERMLLVLQSGTTGVLGLFLLGTCVFGAPAAFTVAKRVRSGEKELVRRWESLYAEESGFRRIFTVITLVWALSLVGEAALRVPVAFLFPLDAAIGLSSVMPAVIITAALVWTSWYGKRAGARYTA